MCQLITHTLEPASADHIQGLMVTGNFALIAGRALHADGGVAGSNPCAAGGRYINSMSSYCANCRYNVRAATDAGRGVRLL